VRNHAKAIIAADFFVVVTARFQFVYVLVIMEIRTRRILHFNVTRHPTAEWTVQQFRECVTGDEGYKFIIHVCFAKIRRQYCGKHNAIE
jgi:putative transposase